MDYKEEQQTELDVLQSIYIDEFELIETEPLVRYRIHVRPESTDDKAAGPAQDEDSESEQSEDDFIASLTIDVTYPPTYPECLPDMTYEDVEGLTEEEEDTLKQRLTAEAEANVGTPSIFTIVSVAKEYLDELALHRQEAEKRREEAIALAEEEAERLRHAGTAVTETSFAAWRTKFEAERRKKELAARSAEADAGIKRKLTGKELFLRDKSLGTSDASYLEAGDEEVDLSAFQRELQQIEAEEEDAEGVLAMLRAQQD